MPEKPTETLKSEVVKEKAQTILGIIWLCGFFAIASTGLNWLLALWAVFAWLLSCLHSARESGWRKIARSYPGKTPFRGQRKHFQGARFNQVASYGNVLIIGTNTNGMRISMSPLLRLAHPPIFVPWEDINGEKNYHTTGYMSPGWMFPTWVSRTQPTVKLHFAKMPSIDIEISRELSEFLEIASDGKWTCD